MFPTVFLKPQMEQVLSLLSSGSTISEAATAAGVHRNTIMNWRRTSTVFQRRWHTMQYEQAMHWREQVQTLVPTALEALRQILEDPKSSTSVRLRAALAVVKDLAMPAPAQPEFPDLNKPRAAELQVGSYITKLNQELESFSTKPPQNPKVGQAFSPVAASAAMPAPNAQTRTSANPEAEQPVAFRHDPAPNAQNCPTPHSKPIPFRRPEPKVGRNEPCPCNSGRKYKYCCAA